MRAPGADQNFQGLPEPPEPFSVYWWEEGWGRKAALFTQSPPTLNSKSYSALLMGTADRAAFQNREENRNQSSLKGKGVRTCFLLPCLVSRVSVH